MWGGMSYSESLVVFLRFCLEMATAQDYEMVQYPQSICCCFLQIVHCSPWNIPERKNSVLAQFTYRKWFEPRSISSLYCAIVQLSVVLKSTVVGDCCFNNLSGSHLQSQKDSVCQSVMVH